MTHYVQPQAPDRSQLYVVPLKNSEALRLPAFGGKGGQSGAIVDPATNRIILTESTNEKKGIKTLLADRRVKTLIEQAAVISHIGLDVEPHEHTIDAIAELHDGTKAGYLFKDEHGATKHSLYEYTANLAAQTPKSVADRLYVVTSRRFPEWHTQNASLLVNARRENRSAVDDALRELAPQLVKPIRIGELSALLGGGQVAFRPIVRALYNGTLTYLGLGSIGITSKVVFSGRVMEDIDRSGPVVDPTQPEPPVFRRRKNVKPGKPRASHRKS